MTRNSEAATVSYHVSVFPERHELHVRVRLVGPMARGRIRLEIPTWVPGDYSFFTIARDLFDVQAVESETARPLSITRDGWQALYVEDGDGDVTVSYRCWAYATELAEPAGIVDHEYAILLGARYLHCAAHRGSCRVTYEEPAAWRGSLHHPSGAVQEDGSWLYPSYEILLDTPVTMGRYTARQRDVSGTRFFFLFVDQGVGFVARVDEFVDQVAAVAAEFRRIFGSFPFQDYTFLLTLNPQADWGLEHLTSTMCGLGPDVFCSADAFATGVRVCAHELFHAWNVRRLRPAPLLHLQEHLSGGSFTEGLWLAEGFTRYYEFLSCTRTCVYDPEQFFSNLLGYWQQLRRVPAYERVSAAESSLTTYLNHSPKYSGRPANCIDYYDKGSLIAFELDARLRLAPEGQSLDRAFRLFYERYLTGGPDYSGYTVADSVAFFEELQPGLGTRLAAAVLKPGGLAVEELLSQLGFVLQHTDRPQLGILFLDDGAPTIYNVLDDSPAGNSGLAPEDVIVGVNEFMYTSSALAWAASQTAPVALEVLRGHRRLRFSVTPAPVRTISRLVWEGDAVQAERLHAWFGRPFPLSPGQQIKLDFYENFHGIETVV